MPESQNPRSETPLPPKTFVFLYKKFALPLMKFLVKRTGGDKEIAEEVFSTTMTAAWQGMHSFQSKSSYFTWLCRIALNKLADYYRLEVHYRSKFVAPTLTELANFKDYRLSLEEQMAIDELRQAIRQCLVLLPKQRRRLIYLRYWEGFND